MKKPYKILVSRKLRFLDEVLEILAKDPGVKIKEDDLANKICFDETDVEILGKLFFRKEFIPENKEIMFTRLACIHLEDLKLLHKYTIIPEKPEYLISYEGIICVQDGGLSAKNIKSSFKSILQNLVWLSTLIAFCINTFLLYFDHNKNLEEANKKIKMIEIKLQEFEKK